MITKKNIFYLLIFFILILISLFLYNLLPYKNLIKSSFIENESFLDDIIRNDKSIIKFERFPLNIKKYGLSSNENISFYTENMYNFEKFTEERCKKFLNRIPHKEKIYLYKTDNIGLKNTRVLPRNNIVSVKKYINDIGTRNEKINEKENNEIRIVLLGGSTTINNSYVNSSSEYLSFYLNKYLRSINSRKKVTVINGGVSGADLVDNYFFFETQLIQLSPDIVIFKESWNNLYRKDNLSEVKLSQLMSNNKLKLYQEFIPKFVDLSNKKKFIFITADMPININLTKQSTHGEQFWDGYDYYTVKDPEFYLEKHYPLLDSLSFKTLYAEIQNYFINLSHKYNFHHLKILEFFTDKKRIFNDLIHKSELGNNLEGYALSNKMIEKINLDKISINFSENLFKNIYNELIIHRIDSTFNCEKLINILK